jgi:hypothetical protein
MRSCNQAHSNGDGSDAAEIADLGIESGLPQLFDTSYRTSGIGMTLMPEFLTVVDAECHSPLNVAIEVTKDAVAWRTG